MRIATVDRVKDGIIYCTMALEARGKPLMGQYVIIPMGEDLLLGRFGSIDLMNPVHDNLSFKPYIMTHGSVPQWSGEVDVEASTIEPIGVVDQKNIKIPRRNNPASGTDIEEACQADLERFYNDAIYKLVLGVIPNTTGLVSTIQNRHFGEFRQGGWGEARHCSIFGQNGSGKTVFALQLMVGKIAAHPQMGLLMPDTAGDLSDPNRHNRGDFKWNYIDALRAAGVTVNVIDIADIRLTSPETLKHVIQPVFANRFSMRSDYALRLADQVIDALCENKNGEINDEVDVADIAVERILEQCAMRIGPLYSGTQQREKTGRVLQIQNTDTDRRIFTRDIDKVRRFFDGREKLGTLIDDILRNGRKVVIRLYGTVGEQEKDYVMRELMEKLVRHARGVFLAKKEESCNALVVLDEGSRWVPEGGRPQGHVGEIIEYAFKETRKYGLGWMVISQRMSGISKNIISESHTRYFGRGLGVGADAQHLEQQLGKTGVEAYEQLEMQGGYFWLGVGMDNNLGTEKAYFKLHPFGGDTTQAFIEANPRIFRGQS